MNNNNSGVSEHAMAYGERPSGRLTLDHVNFSSFAERLKYLHGLLANPQGDFHDQCQAYLQAGCRMFEMDAALISRNLGDHCTVVSCYAPGSNITLGQRFKLNETFCHRVTTAKEALAIADARDENGSLPQAYQGYALGAFLGAPIKVAGHQFGALSFFAGQPKADAFAPQDLETVVLMAQGLARIIELQRGFPKGSLRRETTFATEGVKSFEEYLEMANLPQVFGIAARVVEVLRRRIGHASLSIDVVAEDLNVSKRTLQRRLQQGDINFARLRDQVRFHYAIDYLIEQNQSIDTISAALDFSDRTSFTNAFKRWTGLSPSTFRKLFRDYA